MHLLKFSLLTPDLHLKQFDQPWKLLITRTVLLFSLLGDFSKLTLPPLHAKESEEVREVFSKAMLSCSNKQ